jgi:hypothetical protein
MRTWTRFGMLVVVALGLGCLLAGGRSNAGEADKLKKQVQEIADALKNGKKDMVTDLSKKLAKQEDKDVFAVMKLMQPRDKAGFGVGPTAGDISPDGIELKLTALGRDLVSDMKLKKESKALEEMAYRIGGIAHFAEQCPPAKNKGKATKQKWSEFATGMKESVAEFAKAVQTGSPTEVKKMAGKVNANCNNCHSIFKN